MSANHPLPDMSTLSAHGALLLTHEMLRRQTAGLLVVWRLPDGSEWSAYAVDHTQKSRWVADKSRLGWVHIN